MEPLDISLVHQTTILFSEMGLHFRCYCVSPEIEKYGSPEKDGCSKNQTVHHHIGYPKS